MGTFNLKRENESFFLLFLEVSYGEVDLSYLSSQSYKTNTHIIFTQGKLKFKEVKYYS